VAAKARIEAMVAKQQQKAMEHELEVYRVSDRSLRSVPLLRLAVYNLLVAARLLA
jgi:hypothetical protein